MTHISIDTKYPAHLILRHLIALKEFSKISASYENQYLCNFLNPPVSFSLLGPSYLLRILSTKILNTCSSLRMRDLSFTAMQKNR
jgi:hypothetical protein